MAVQSPRGLDGTDSFSLSLWVLWKDKADRQYPNVLTSRTWSPGGMMIFVNNGACSFRMGRPDVKGEGWQETSVPFLYKIPVNEWVHLCVTFQKPSLTTYVNGRKVASVQWKYPLQCDAIRLGGWHTDVTHYGLMDDFRIYGKALDASAVTVLASEAKRESPDFSVHESKPLPSVALYENASIIFGLDKRGRLSKLYSKTLNKSLMDGSTALVSVFTDSGRKVKTHRMTVQDHDRLRFYFPNIPGYVDLKIREINGLIEVDPIECGFAGY